MVFGWKMTLGVRFFEFFTSKNMPPYGTCHGCKFFLISQSRLDMCWGTSQRSLPSSGRDGVVCKSQNDVFWKSCLDENQLWGHDFSDFSIPKTCPRHGQNGWKKICHTSMLSMWSQYVTITLCHRPSNPYRFCKGQNRYPLKTCLKISQKIPKNHQKSEKIQKIQKSKNCPKKSQKTLHYAEMAFFPIFAVFCQ